MEVLLDVDCRYLHYLLLCRGVIRGEVASDLNDGDREEEEDEEGGDAGRSEKKKVVEVPWTRERVVKMARHEALVEASIVTSR